MTDHVLPVAEDRAAVDGRATVDGRRAHAWAVAATVTDPELPMLTLADLGVLRGVTVDADGTVVVVITPTYSGCPAMDAMRDDLVHRLRDAGFAAVDVRTELAPAWSTDDITAAGRRALAAHGIAPPGPAPRTAGPVLVSLQRRPSPVRCPRCGAADTEVLSPFSSTACRALRRCHACAEPFEHVKER